MTSAATSTAVGTTGMTDPRKVYKEAFFTELGNAESAAVVVPLVLQVVQAGSVVDVGCGVGSWLSEFQKHGVKEIFGIDGDYVPRHLLQIPVESFLAADLSQPLDIGRRFDWPLAWKSPNTFRKARQPSLWRA